MKTFVTHKLILTLALPYLAANGQKTSTMKKGIHPQYNDNVKVTCSCGATLETGSTLKNLDIEICSQCHPFYTGKKKVLDSTGRVDRFKKLAEKSAAAKKAPKKPRAQKTETEKEAK